MAERRWKKRVTIAAVTLIKNKANIKTNAVAAAEDSPPETLMAKS
jgi:hypothetical protein